MGHLINPTALRIGWFSNWKDSWYADLVYYPEFLHDIFRIRLYFNYLFARTFFDRKGLLLSHFEIYFKYNYLVVNFFYYDSALIAGMFAFDLEFANRYMRRKFYFLRRRKKKFEHSRFVTLFLGILYSLFTFTEIIKMPYVRRSIAFDNTGSYRIFDYERGRKWGVLKEEWMDSEIAKWYRTKRLVTKINRQRMRRHLASTAEEDLVKKARFKFKPTVSFPVFSEIFQRKFFFKRLPWWLRNKRRSQNYKLISPSENLTMHVDDIAFYARMYPTWPYYVRRGWVRRFRYLTHKLGKKYYFFNTPWFRRRFSFFFRRYTVCKLLTYAGPGHFDKLLSVFFFSDCYKDSFFRPEFKLLLVFIFLFRRVWQLFRLEDVTNREKKDNFFKALFLNTTSLFFFRRWKFNFLSKFFACIIRLLVPRQAVKVGIFLLSNETVTARFLSTFIAKRLVQGYTVRQVVSPILRDLYYVAFCTRMARSTFALRAMNFQAVYRKSIVKNTVLRFLYFYKRLFVKVFRQQSTWVNFYSLVFLRFFYNRIIKFRGARRRSRRLRVSISRRFALRRASFLFFFAYNFSLVNNNLGYVFNEIFVDSFLEQMRYSSVFYFYIIDDLFSNFRVLLFTELFKINVVNSFGAMGCFFNRLVQFNYNKYNYSWVIAFNKLSKLHLRVKEKRLHERNFLLGYKMHLRGRFSRKQRASSLWFFKGLVPLNTLSAPIDYSFYAVPLRNSLASVKVWVYRDKFYPRWFVRQS